MLPQFVDEFFNVDILQVKEDEKKFRLPIDVKELKTKKSNVCHRFSMAIRKKESTMIKLKQAMIQLAKGTVQLVSNIGIQ